MKFALILLAFVGFSTAAVVIDKNFQSSELANDLQEFVDLIPMEKILDITFDYLIEDEQFEDVVLYLNSNNFKKFIIDVESLPQVQVLLDYLESNGVPIYELLNKLNNLLDIDPIKPYTNLAHITGGGIKGYLKDVLEVLPLNKLQDLYVKKLFNSEAFADFIAQLKSDNFKEIVNYVYKHPEFQNILQKLKNADVDTSIINKLLFNFLGIKLPEKFFF